MASKWSPPSPQSALLADVAAPGALESSASRAAAAAVSESLDVSSSRRSSSRAASSGEPGSKVTSTSCPDAAALSRRSCCWPREAEACAPVSSASTSANLFRTAAAASGSSGIDPAGSVKVVRRLPAVVSVMVVVANVAVVDISRAGSGVLNVTVVEISRAGSGKLVETTVDEVPVEASVTDVLVEASVADVLVEASVADVEVEVVATVDGGVGASVGADVPAEPSASFATIAPPALQAPSPRQATLARPGAAASAEQTSEAISPFLAVSALATAATSPVLITQFAMTEPLPSNSSTAMLPVSSPSFARAPATVPLTLSRKSSCRSTFASSVSSARSQPGTVIGNCARASSGSAKEPGRSASVSSRRERPFTSYMSQQAFSSTAHRLRNRMQAPRCTCSPSEQALGCQLKPLHPAEAEHQPAHCLALPATVVSPMPILSQLAHPVPWRASVKFTPAVRGTYRSLHLSAPVWHPSAKR
mmetsp:Transcript_34729/g.92087  ORF Transcript_34729/g.92087 Transcript_34729/m.92087 type:complete len:477 (-) Transcript_34729:200-1630(-)